MTSDRIKLISDLEKYLKSLQVLGIKELSISPEIKKIGLIGKEKSNTHTESRKGRLSSELHASAKTDKNESTEPVVLKNVWGDIYSPLIFFWEYPSEETLAQKSEQKIFEIIEKGMKLPRKNICMCSVVTGKKVADSATDETKNIQFFLKPLKPKVIVVMGSLPSSALGLQIDIVADRGKWLYYGKIKVIATHHPEYLLKNYTEKIRREIFEDMKKVLKEL
jgi:uracil-DNA glycosylase family 4